MSKDNEVQLMYGNVVTIEIERHLPEYDTIKAKVSVSSNEVIETVELYRKDDVNSPFIWLDMMYFTGIDSSNSNHYWYETYDFDPARTNDEYMYRVTPSFTKWYSTYMDKAHP